MSTSTRRSWSDQGALGSLLAAREGEAYKATDDYFGGQAVWQNFSDWLAQIPAVNYGIFTNEVDAAVAAQLPALAAGRLGRRSHRGHRRPGHVSRSSKCLRGAARAAP